MTATVNVTMLQTRRGEDGTLWTAGSQHDASVAFASLLIGANLATGDLPTVPPSALDATQASLVAFNTWAAAANIAGSDRLRSALRSIADYDDTAGTIFTESWADMTGWTMPGTPGMQVSAGRMYSVGTQNAGSGGNHSFALGAAECLRVVMYINRPATGGSGGLIVGVSSDTAGGTPTSGAGAAFAVQFPANNTLPTLYSGGSSSAITNAPTLTAGDYIAVITVDLAYISISARKTDGTVEFVVRRARSGFSVNNIYLFNSDPRATSGLSVGALSARKSLTTITPRTHGEGVTYTTQWSGDGTNGWTVSLPANYDSRKPSPVAMCFHGNGSDETLGIYNSNQQLVTRALAAAGYIVVWAAASSTQTWGNAASQAANLAAYRYVRDNYNIGPVVFYGQSMGGIEALNALAMNVVPGVVAAAFTVPAYSLANNFANALFTSAITTAYSISASNPYAVASEGFDPARRDGGAFGAIPMWMLVATDDVSVNPAQNGLALYASVRSKSRASTLVTATGGHSIALGSYTAAIVSFFNQYSAG